MNIQKTQNKKKLINEMKQNLSISTCENNINENIYNLNSPNDNVKILKKNVLKNPSILSGKDHISISSKNDSTKIGVNDFDLKFKLYPIKKHKNLWTIFTEIAETYKNMIIAKSIEHRSFNKRINMKSANCYKRSNLKKQISNNENNKSKTDRIVYTLSNLNLHQNIPFVYKTIKPIKIQKLNNKYFNNFPIFKEINSPEYPLSSNQNFKMASFLRRDNNTSSKIMRDKMTNTSNVFIKYLRKDKTIFNTDNNSENNKVNLFINLRNSPKKINLKKFVINKDKNSFRGCNTHSNLKNKRKIKNVRANCYFNKLYLKKIDKTIDKYSFNSKD